MTPIYVMAPEARVAIGAFGARGVEAQMPRNILYGWGVAHLCTANVTCYG
jgi:hypothetical protein